MDHRPSSSAPGGMLERAKTRYHSSLSSSWYTAPQFSSFNNHRQPVSTKDTNKKRKSRQKDVFDGDSSSHFPPTSHIFNQRRISGPQVSHATAKNTATNRKKRSKAWNNGKRDGSHATSPFFPPPPHEKHKFNREISLKTLDGIVHSVENKSYSNKMRGMTDNRLNDIGKSGTDGMRTVERSSSDLAAILVPARLKNGKTRKLDPGALGQREISRKDWVPPVSVHALIQEELYKDPWKLLVACMLLNKTSGIQMRTVIWELFDLCPTPEAAVAVPTCDIEKVIRPLGLQRKRACMIQKFSHDYLGKDWSNVAELHGIGKYATDAYAIFCEGRWREVKPEDHKLVDYWQYLCATDGLGYAFKDDRE